MTTEQTRDVEERDALVEEPATPEAEASRRRGKSAAVGGVLLCLLVLSGGSAYLFTSGGKKQVDVGRKGATVPADKSGEVQTDAVVSSLNQQFDDGATRPGGAGVASPAVEPAASADASEGTGAATAPGVAGTVATESAAAPPPAAPAEPAGSPEPPTARKNPQRSFFYGPPPPATTGVPTTTVAATSRRPGPAPVVPPFGTTLPVRTLGKLFTLASGGIVRLELARDIGGSGWSLKKGTILVGTVRGGEAERAFVSVIGFIDPTTNRLVEVKGDALGADGGSGIPGKRKKVGSGWTRVLGAVGRTAVGVASTAAQVATANAVGTRYGSRIILRDMYGAAGLPLGNEFSAVSTKDSSYIEVAAGTVGYVLITDLPERVAGVDALVEVEPEQIEEYADVARRRAATGLSEEELSHLVTEGTPEEIRAAMPRMTPAMRAVAEKVLANVND